jgi:large subunit ribosomal protein L38
MNSLIFNRNITSPLVTFVRHGHRIRGKPPGVAKTLSQVLEEINHKDPVLHKKHDIGFPCLRTPRNEQYKYRHEIVQKNRKDQNLEKLSRSKQRKNSIL